MTQSVRLREEAERDLADAATWYEAQRPGLGHAFLDDALAAFRLIEERPLTFPELHRRIRRALLRRFPFGAYFRVDGGDIVVIAVMHGSRHPRRWQHRD